MSEKRLLVQGDVFLVSEKIPEEAKRIAKRPLAVGERTGHAHEIAGEEHDLYEAGGVLHFRTYRAEENYELYELDGVLYLRTHKPVTLRHPEHKPITIDRGEWRVGIVKEFDPFEEEVRNVKD